MFEHPSIVWIKERLIDCSVYYKCATNWKNNKGECRLHSIYYMYLIIFFLNNFISNDWSRKAKKKYMCVYCHMSKKSRVGRSALNFFFNYRQNQKWSFPVPESDSGISFSKFPVSRHLLKLFYDELQFSYLLCSQFQQKPSGWKNKTLLLIKQQKWLSEFCGKIDRVASKN